MPMFLLCFYCYFHNSSVSRLLVFLFTQYFVCFFCYFYNSLFSPKTSLFRFRRVIQDNMIGACSSGWMSDFGEYLPFDAVIANGDASTYHNLYPQRWAEVNRAAVQSSAEEPPKVCYRVALCRSLSKCLMSTNLGFLCLCLIELS